MTNITHGFHHQNIRKRIYLKHEPYPNPDKWKRFMDKGIYVVGVISPIMMIPQLAKIWILKNAESVSLISWSTYLFTAIFWLIYGIMHNEKPIILTNSLWIFLNVFIIIGIILFG